MLDYSIQKQKLAQAVDILREKKIDAWLTFVRETSHNADPALNLILGFDVTWHSAFIVTRSGHKIAIVGRFDGQNIRGMNAYDEVIAYDQSIQPELVRVIDSLNVKQIAVNYSEGDSSADGLSHGMYLTLARYFKGKPYEMISAQELLSALRGRKSPTEIERIRNSVKITEEIIDGITAMLKPGLSETDIADYVKSEFARRGVEPAWEAAYCPTVNCGPDSVFAHAMPSPDRVLQAGHIVHVDLGVKANGYVSDMQRLWYLQPKGETEIPSEIQRAFQTILDAIDASARLLRPGVQGWQVDAAAREAVTNGDYPEFMHGLGHHIGMTTHDGSTLLGPRWERYGNAPEGMVEAGNVYTIEPSAGVPGVGMIALEEDVLVTENGLEWLSTPQRELIVVKA